MNLQETNPAEDLHGIFTGPRDFFRSLIPLEGIDGWVLVKAVGGAWVAFSLIYWSAMPRHLFTSMAAVQSIFDGILSLMSTKFSLAFQGVDEQIIQGLQDAIPAAIGLSILKALLVPVLKIVLLFIVAFGVMLMLPLLGVPSSKTSYFQILAVLAYCQWFALLALIPGIGELLANIALIIMPVIAIRSLYDISILRSYAALLFFPMLMICSFIFSAFFFFGLSLG